MTNPSHSLYVAYGLEEDSAFHEFLVTEDDGKDFFEGLHLNFALVEVHEANGDRHAIRAHLIAFASLTPLLIIEGDADSVVAFPKPKK